jgi:hypothetical protein
MRMPNTADMNEFVVAGEDVKDGDMIVFVDGGTWHTYDDGRKTIQFNVTLPDGRTKIISLNKTSANNLTASYGSATEEWEGKSALVSVVKTNVKGQMKNVIYLFPVK